MLDDHLFSAVRDCLLNTFKATFHTCEQQARHATMTGTHLSQKLYTTGQSGLASAGSCQQQVAGCCEPSGAIKHVEFLAG